MGGFQDPYFQENGKFRKIIEFLKRLSKSFQVNYNGIGVGLITYGSSAHVSFDLHPFVTVEHLTKAIDEASAPDVGENLEDGLTLSDEFWHYSLLSRDKLTTLVVVSILYLVCEFNIPGVYASCARSKSHYLVDRAIRHSRQGY